MTPKEYEAKTKVYLHHLQYGEEKPRSKNTILQYERALKVFDEFLIDNDIEEINKESVIKYIHTMEKQLEAYDKGEKPKTVNGKRPVASFTTVKMRVRTLNAFFDYIDRRDLRTSVQYRESENDNTNENELTDLDYLKLLDFTKSEKMKLIMETLAFTGIRISELEYITVESLKDRKPKLWNKGKRRTGYIPKGLAKKLRAYAKENGIDSGIIFRSRPLKDKDGNYIDRDGKPAKEPVYKMISQSYIRDEMKRIAGQARMKRSKVHPHNFRHFYATKYANKPNANHYILPVLLGHSTNDRSQGVTARYVKQSSSNILKVADELEVYINAELKEAQKTRAKNKKLAEAKKKRNQANKKNK